MELDELRARASATERELEARERGGVLSSTTTSEASALRRELRSKIAECEALREQRDVLYQEVEDLTLRLQRATPHRRELETVRERLRQALADLDRSEAEIRRLRGSVVG